MKINNLLLLANAEPETKTFMAKQVKAHDFFVAVDGGANTAVKAGLMPDMVIGDLDSITPKTAKKIGEIKLIKVNRQDNTDLEKALDFAAYLKPKSCTILCATGGRIDFMLSNFSSVFKYIKLFDIVFLSEKWRIYPINKTQTFKVKKGSTVSIIPMGKTTGITLTNLKYPLKDAKLDTGLTAVSNVAKGNTFKVALKQGKLLVMIYD